MGAGDATGGWAQPRREPLARWSDGDAYEAYVGRWSRLVAQEFLAWLDAPHGLRWLDVGAGTGVVSAAIAASVEPSEVVGVDASGSYVQHARRLVDDPRVHFEQGDACSLQYDSCFDAAVSGLVLNFVADARSAVDGMGRAVVYGGLVASYVWDYAHGMELTRHFWDAAASVDASARGLHQGERLPLCDPAELDALWNAVGLESVQTSAIQVMTPFRNFDDYWKPFLGGQGAAPAYAASLPAPQRDAVREAVRSRLPIKDDGSIQLTARAWAVKGTTSSKATSAS